MGKLVPFRRLPRRRLPAAWAPYLRRPALPAAQIRLTIWIGLLLGLLAYQALRLLPPPYAPLEPPPVQALDPYVEARRSRAILEAQEGAPPRPADAPASAATERVTASVRVIDGDTFETGGIRVRVADIDPPEVRGRCAYETALAARATARMRSLLAAGPFELHALADGRDEDAYGRKLRIVTRDGRSLGDVLVAEGLARTWTGRREPWCSQ